MKTTILLMTVLLTSALQADEWSDKRDAARAKAMNRGALTEAKAKEKVSPGAPTGLLVRAPTAAALEQVALRVPGFVNGDSTTSHESALAEAKQLYPALLDAGSAFSRRCAELVEWLRLRQHPFASDARMPLIVAHLAATELNGRAKPDSRGVYVPPKVKEAPSMAQMQADLAAANAEVSATGPMLSSALPAGDIRFRVSGDNANFSSGATGRIRTDIAGRRMLDLGALTQSGLRREVELPKDLGGISRPFNLPDGTVGRIREFGGEVVIER